MTLWPRLGASLGLCRFSTTFGLAWRSAPGSGLWSTRRRARWVAGAAPRIGRSRPRRARRRCRRAPRRAALPLAVAGPSSLVPAAAGDAAGARGAGAARGHARATRVSARPRRRRLDLRLAGADAADRHRRGQRRPALRSRGRRAAPRGHLTRQRGARKSSRGEIPGVRVSDERKLDHFDRLCVGGEISVEERAISGGEFCGRRTRLCDRPR